MIKFLVMDVDGTLTDGKIYMGADGEAFKAFDIKDGYALHTLLKEHGIIPVIITARKSSMVEHRCKELGVTEIHQGVINKLDCLKGILERYSSADQQYDLSNVAYIGDDLLDLQCMYPIKESGGLVGCPSNAVSEVSIACDFLAPHKGGEGAVRDFAEYIIKRERSSWSMKDINLKNRLDKALAYIANLNHSELRPGRYDVSEDFYYKILEYKANDEEESVWESHKKYIDIQLIIHGKELLYLSDIKNLVPMSIYDDDNDIIYYNSSCQDSKVLLIPGSFIVIYPKDAHRAVGYQLEKKMEIKKIVGKLKLIK